MFNGGTLLLLIFAIGVPLALYWPEIRALLIFDAPANHPDTVSSMDCRERGLHPIDGVLEHEYQQHEKRMNARATELGYRR